MSSAAAMLAAPTAVPAATPATTAKSNGSTATAADIEAGLKKPQSRPEDFISSLLASLFAALPPSTQTEVKTETGLSSAPITNDGELLSALQQRNTLLGIQQQGGTLTDEQLATFETLNTRILETLTAGLPQVKADDLEAITALLSATPLTPQDMEAFKQAVEAAKTAPQTPPTKVQVEIAAPNDHVKADRTVVSVSQNAAAHSNAMQPVVETDLPATEPAPQTTITTTPQTNSETLAEPLVTEAEAATIIATFAKPSEDKIAEATKKPLLWFEQKAEGSVSAPQASAMAEAATGKQATSKANLEPQHIKAEVNIKAEGTAAVTQGGLNFAALSAPLMVDTTTLPVIAPQSTAMPLQATLTNVITQSPSAVAYHPAISQITHAMEKAAAQNNIKQLQIQLEPIQLGKIRVDMSYQAGKAMKINIVTEKSETLQMLEQDKSQLQTALGKTGLDMGGNSLEFSFSHDQSAFQQAMGDHQNQSGSSFGDHLSGKAQLNAQEIAQNIETSLDFVPDSAKGNLYYSVLA